MLLDDLIWIAMLLLFYFEVPFVARALLPFQKKYKNKLFRKSVETLAWIQNKMKTQ